MSAPCLTICYECGCEKCASNTEKAFLGKSKSCLLNCACSPVALTTHSFYAYFFVCVYVYLQRLANHLICFACVHFGACKYCFKFRDRRFKADDVSLGIKSADKNIVWKRATDVIKRPVLFQKDVEPNDVVQGNVENCWLMSAFACIAEFPSVVDKVFINREYSFRGKYKVTLYNAYEKKWQVITVDDYFPFREKGAAKVPAEEPEKKEEADLEKGEGEGEGDMKAKETKALPPAEKTESQFKWEYARPQDDELWVPVLEKAFAKFRGSYHNLRGGHLMWAFQCLTGDNVFRLTKIKEGDRAGVWEQVVLAKDLKPTDLGAISAKKTGHTRRHNELFETLRSYDRSKALIGASISLTPHENAEEPIDGDRELEEKDPETGLVKGHAYSIIQAKRVGSQPFELVQLRNPWGKFEWTGDWSDESEKWTEHPDVAKTLNFNKDLNDGTFWMEFSDFARYFDDIDICDRTVNYSDFHLDVHENPKQPLKHCFGPLQGCIEGCFTFWCKCRGIRTIYCGNDSDAVLRKKKKGRGRDDGMLANFDLQS